MVQIFVLTMPLVTLGIGISGLHHFIGHACFTTLPFWDLLLGVVVPLGMVVIALGALGLGGLRLILMARVVWRCRTPAPVSLQEWTNTLVERLGIASTRVQICDYHRPLALTCGYAPPHYPPVHLDALEPRLTRIRGCLDA
ncbi:hypothetical protein KSF_058590 [Reticulibacter mediterranei]|uniref:Uncharacterized protein n=1 Tax=Reticulibacter mediterranei TaxID=2778369 RepID=A0A8J3IV37_9CHLR|nr:hypothetical protein [Reticulibacter mediterranei]GHO95811.1 hypothetical protein KSF_058590 [Reticulibacter mediterranei]